jgi:hypothetical protein
VNLREPEAHSYDKRRPNDWNGNKLCDHPRLTTSTGSNKAKAAPDKNQEPGAEESINELNMVCTPWRWKNRAHECRKSESEQKADHDQNFLVDSARPKLDVLHTLTNETTDERHSKVSEFDVRITAAHSVHRLVTPSISKDGARLETAETERVRNKNMRTCRLQPRKEQFALIPAPPSRQKQGAIAPSKPCARKVSWLPRIVRSENSATTAEATRGATTRPDNLYRIM